MVANSSVASTSTQNVDQLYCIIWLSWKYIQIIYRYDKKVDKSCPPYLTARCASSLVYLSKDFLHDLPSLSDKENRARQVEYKYKSSTASIVWPYYLLYPHRAVLSISWCQMRSLKHSELVAVVRNDSIYKIHWRNCNRRVYRFYRIKLRKD